MHLDWRPVAPGGGPAIPTSITQSESDELARLVAARRYREGRREGCLCADCEPLPVDVLEIGSAYGYSAVLLAGAGAHVTAVDPHDWIPGSLQAMHANLGFYQLGPMVDIILEPSQSAMPKLEATGARYDLVFVDGDHAEHAALHDTRAALRLLRPGGVVAVHDYGETCCCPGVEAALHKILPGLAVDVRQVDTMLVLTPLEATS